MNTFIKPKFQTNGLNMIRWQDLEAGGQVAFLVSGTVVSANPGQVREDADFEKMADEIVDKLRVKERTRVSKFCFEFDGEKFIETEPEKQTWFTFTNN